MPFLEIKDLLQAERYVAEQLSEGTTLARTILNSVDLSRGKYRVAMPASIDQGEPLDFRFETLRLAHDEEAAFARLIRCFIRHPRCALLMEDREAKMSDPVMETLPLRNLAIPYHQELYWRVSGSQLANLPDNEMLDVVNTTSYFPWVGFFYIDGVSRSKDALSDADLDHVVKNLVGIGISAFDSRSFMIWWRDDLWSFPEPPSDGNDRA